uniref:Uncharacterized protein n=1 Tax=Solanum lycopersicum TaxID=4081 RepID=A0A3Q7J9W5_SOLLC
MELNEQIDPVANWNVEKAKTTRTCVPTKDSQIPFVKVSHEQLLRNELSELQKEHKKNNDNAGQGSQPFTSPILSENQNQNNINNHNAAQGRQHFTSPVASENQNQIIELLNSSLINGALITIAWLSVVLLPFIIHMPIFSS